jgi:lipopolysaccharide assembly protein A
MRWFYLVVVILFVAVTLIFVLQNFDLVTMAFLGMRIRAPLALVVAVVYVLGAITGGSLFALLRHSIRESKAGVQV